MKEPVSMLAGWLAVFVCVSARQPAPTAQLPTFRTGVDAIQLDVSVFEDGKPRKVVAFSAVERPDSGGLHGSTSSRRRSR